MALARISGVRVRGIVSSIPAKTLRLEDEAELYGGNQAQIDRLKATIGLDQRRVVPDGMTSLDLSLPAARRVLEACGVEPKSIDGIICVTQTPDYPQPGNGVLLQGQLGCGEGCAAFDINLGCSGYVYGLWMAHSLIAGGGLNRVLLIAADTVSRIVSEEDKALRPLFGDAASATLLEADATAPEATFDLRSDGTGYAALWQPGGGFREPLDSGNATRMEIDAGIRRRRDELHMDGAAIFNFSLKVEPPAIKEILEASGWESEAVRGFVFHQANRYIIENIRRRLKLPAEKVPSGTVEKYGNSSGASIPVTLCDHYGKALEKGDHPFVLSGFGVGLSWASCALHLSDLDGCELLEVGSKAALA
jgi:3-oxoacyl-[acyl-carrier-protein] synthase-3